MTNFARIINNVAVDVSANPAECFHPTIAAEFVSVPDAVQHGWMRTDGKWAAPAVADASTPVLATITPLQFKLLWTADERLGTVTLRASDALVADFMSLIEDPQRESIDLNLPSVQAGILRILTLLAHSGLFGADLVPARQAQINSLVYQ